MQKSKNVLRNKEKIEGFIEDWKKMQNVIKERSKNAFIFN